jgi:hypothetical protein
MPIVLKHVLLDICHVMGWVYLQLWILVVTGAIRSRRSQGFILST